MCDQHRLPISLLHFAAIASATVALTGSLFAPQGIAQITIGNVTPLPDTTQDGQTCANYNMVLASTGVPANSWEHPGQCRATAITPLFDGIPLGTNMRAFFDNPSHPPLFKAEVPSLQNGRFDGTQATDAKGPYCVVNSKLKVTLSASLQATRLQWTDNANPPSFSKCSGEKDRVNGASAPSSPAITPAAQAKLSALLSKLAGELDRVPQMKGCGATSAAATNSLEKQVWKLLQDIADLEVRRFQASIAPEMDARSLCAAKCNLCFSGWVGQVHCTADANQPDNEGDAYFWHEEQTWDVGGTPPSGTAGRTDYPAMFTSTGSGSKTPPSGTGVSWTINATAMGTLSDYGMSTNGNKRFVTSNVNATGGGITMHPGGLLSPDGEMQVGFNADQGAGNTADSNSPTADMTPKLPSSCNAQQAPGVTCTMTCSWNLSKQ